MSQNIACALAEGYEIATRHMIMERDLNSFGHLFGGSMLAWLDEGTALFLMDKIGFSDFVTVSMQNVDFTAPGRRGDPIVICCRILKTGRSSVVAQSKAFAQDPLHGNDREIISCEITYVCLKNDKPYPYFQSEQYLKRLAAHVDLAPLPPSAKIEGPNATAEVTPEPAITDAVNPKAPDEAAVITPNQDVNISS